MVVWGKKLLLSLSVFAIMLRKRLPDGSEQKRWFESLMILAALLGTQTCFSMASHQDSFGILLSMYRFLSMSLLKAFMYAL